MPPQGDHRRARFQSRYGIKRGVNRSDAAAKPAQCAWQSHVDAAQRIGRSLHARGRGHRGDSVFDRGKQPWQPGGEKVWNQTECSVALRTVPPGDAQTLQGHSCIAAVASDGAAALRMQGTREQVGMTPLASGDVGFDTRLRMQRDLQGHSQTRRRTPTLRQELCGVHGTHRNGAHGETEGQLQIKRDSR